MALRIVTLAWMLVISLVTLLSGTRIADCPKAGSPGSVPGLSSAGSHWRAAAGDGYGHSPAPRRCRATAGFPDDLLPCPMISDDEDDESEGIFHGLGGSIFESEGFDRAIPDLPAMPAVPLVARLPAGRTPLRC